MRRSRILEKLRHPLASTAPQPRLAERVLEKLSQRAPRLSPGNGIVFYLRGVPDSASGFSWVGSGDEDAIDPTLDLR